MWESCEGAAAIPEWIEDAILPTLGEASADGIKSQRRIKATAGVE